VIAPFRARSVPNNDARIAAGVMLSLVYVLLCRRHLGVGSVARELCARGVPHAGGR